MKEIYQMAVLGGDSRMCALCRFLEREGHRVKAYAVPHSSSADDAETAMDGQDILILPLPASRDGVRLFAPELAGLSRRLSSIADAFSGRLVLGGRLPSAFSEMLLARGIRVIDYYESEILQLKNALPSAEGAISLAMRELPVTLDGATAGVIGYGRIGSLLAQKLEALGCRVKVFARRPLVLAAIGLAHHIPIPLEKDDGYRALLEGLQDCRVVFNTVPTPILTEENLSAVPKSCLLIDLASPPGGIRIPAAEALGRRAIWATALPGKYAPETAGELLGESILSLLDDFFHDKKEN